VLCVFESKGNSKVGSVQWRSMRSTYSMQYSTVRYGTIQCISSNPLWMHGDIVRHSYTNMIVREDFSLKRITQSSG
jgi:hypothetical protein